MDYIALGPINERELAELFNLESVDHDSIDDHGREVHDVQKQGIQQLVLDPWFFRYADVQVIVQIQIILISSQLTVFRPPNPL